MAPEPAATRRKGGMSAPPVTARQLRQLKRHGPVHKWALTVQVPP